MPRPQAALSLLAIASAIACADKGTIGRVDSPSTSAVSLASASGAVASQAATAVDDTDPCVKRWGRVPMAAMTAHVTYVRVNYSSDVRFCLDHSSWAVTNRAVPVPDGEHEYDLGKTGSAYAPATRLATGNADPKHATEVTFK
jgi:hypothetical protein